MKRDIALDLGAVWVPAILWPVANVVQNTVMPDLTFNLKIAGHFGFGKHRLNKKGGGISQT